MQPPPSPLPLEDENAGIFGTHFGLLGREFMRYGPARGTAHKTKPFLPVEPVNLVNHPVDIVVEFGARLLDCAVKRDQLLDRVADFGQRIYLESERLDSLQKFPLALVARALDRARRMAEDVERTGGADPSRRPLANSISTS